MKIKSVFENQTKIPSQYTCLGLNINPPLAFEEVSYKTKSLVLLVEDIDASPAPWTHWHVFNIPPTTKSVKEGQIPDGASEGLCNNHTFGYEGPCPTYFNGVHRYVFKLYALDKQLDLPSATEPEQIKEVMNKHIIETAELIGLCSGNLGQNLRQEVTDSGKNE